MSAHDDRHDQRQTDQRQADQRQANRQHDERELATALSDALGARDRSMRTPAFSSLWSQAGARGGLVTRWRPAIAAATLLAVLAGLTWTLTGRIDIGNGATESGGHSSYSDASADLALARELSSPDYWRVPTDELMAFAAPPLSADLPSPRGFEVSLEESLL